MDVIAIPGVFNSKLFIMRSLFIILFIGIRLLKLDFKKGVAILSTLLFIILTLGINKVHTYMDSIFLPASVQGYFSRQLVITRIPNCLKLWSFTYNLQLPTVW